ncbi:hypothetical protein [Bifidobacterium sp. SO1]|uniref:hypothetical protein n=1 Tax=Bifidobacterium sp. SO1 TaxID=2809029 RepID=UPI001BDD7FCA|nr:hypothetical protein [Bifidobacterium sp. SO1]MBT1162814.1 hypothetical protein [Bifidobacterium sp. SO1]
MMVDYSQWLYKAGQHSEILTENGTLGFTVLVLGSGVAIAIILAQCVFVTDANRKGFDRSLIVCLLACILGSTLALTGIRTNPAYDPDTPTFVEQTEQTFGITQLQCDGTCYEDELPENGTTVTYLKGDHLTHGTLIITGSKVGLAGPDGTLLKADES